MILYSTLYYCLLSSSSCLLIHGLCLLVAPLRSTLLYYTLLYYTLLYYTPLSFICLFVLLYFFCLSSCLFLSVSLMCRFGLCSLIALGFLLVPRYHPVLILVASGLDLHLSKWRGYNPETRKRRGCPGAPAFLRNGIDASEPSDPGIRAHVAFMRSSARSRWVRIGERQCPLKINIEGYGKQESIA